MGLPRADSITIVNVSSGGIAFSSCDELAVGQTVSITTARRSVTAVVRHASPTGRGFYVGAQIADSPDESDLRPDMQSLASKLDETTEDSSE